MKKLFFLLTMSSLFLLSCTGKSGNKTINNVQNYKEVNQVTRPFSDLTKADTFRVVLSGSKPKDMLLTFRIIAFNGKEIYQKTLKAAELINNYKASVDLKKELNLFLEEENFLEPAVVATEQPDQNTKDKLFYAELKKSGLNGFKYRLGKDSELYIAWSEKEQKVKVYYQCC
jgi:hypothetical protein